jgi:serine/threonine-protein kinase
MSTGASAPSAAPVYRAVRILGARASSTYAAIRSPHELVVAVRFLRVETEAHTTGTRPGPVGITRLNPESMALLLRDARCLAKNFHPNIARVRHVDLAGNELTVASELVDGATLADLLRAAGASSPRDLDEAWMSDEPIVDPAILVRILVDVLAGLNGLHSLRDDLQAALGVIHGELCPANIVVGKDGVARIVHSLRARPLRVAAASEALGYAAPEALDVGGTDDARADVYAVGVMLWEALTGRRLYTDTDPVRLLARQREEEISLPMLDPGSPFAALGEVAMRAIAFDPAIRFRSAAEMAAELRRLAGNQLASGSVVAAWVATLAGERIRARRLELDPTSRARGSDRSVQTAPPVAAPSERALPAAQPSEPAATAPSREATKVETASERALRAARGAPAEAAPKHAAVVGLAAVTSEGEAGREAHEAAPASNRPTLPPVSLDAAAEAPAPSERTTVPPLSFDPDDMPPSSRQPETSLRDLMSSAPPLHASSMVPATHVAAVLAAPLEAQGSGMTSPAGGASPSIGAPGEATASKPARPPPPLAPKAAPPALPKSNPALKAAPPAPKSEPALKAAPPPPPPKSEPALKAAPPPPPATPKSEPALKTALPPPAPKSDPALKAAPPPPPATPKSEPAVAVAMPAMSDAARATAPAASDSAPAIAVVPATAPVREMAAALAAAAPVAPTTHFPMVAPSPAREAAPIDAATPEDEAWRIPKQRTPLTWLVVAGAIALLGGAVLLAREVLADGPPQGATLPIPVATEQLPSTAVTAPPTAKAVVVSPATASALSPAASASAKVSLTNADSETKSLAEAKARADAEAAEAKARADAEAAAARSAPVVQPQISPPVQPQQRPALTPQGSQGNPRPRKSSYDPMGI